MKKKRFYGFAAIGTALMVSTFAAFPAFAANFSGHLDTASSTAITGWAWDSEAPDTAVSIELKISGSASDAAGSTTFMVSANQYREDLNVALGSGSHGFVYEIDWSNFAADTYTVTAAAVSGETKTPLIGSITYLKETASAPADDKMNVTVVPESVQAPAIPETNKPEETQTPAETKPSAGPGQNTPSTKSYGPSSGLTPSQISMGPGYANGVSSNKKGSNKTSYGPGSASYETGEPGQYLGSFHATAYCGCERCSGGHALTYSGTIPQPNHTIATDLNLYPIGTKLWIDGIVYTVEDKGSSVVDNRIDIFFATHAEALAFGLQNIDVYTVK